ncbi:hypothetical protein OV090_06750 [Nannocystis sp. RBIL2]|uniref:hypothetical protein n=1 Tax=Nannocystis sp. RBIL2 TaxID=2996788 RepID=UPI002270836E|nr:hypothetical protein [Nannocystis sp. RBIL2]MCY1064451.1 hypothetical protein [Nannocystis sp. RBIL2]
MAWIVWRSMHAWGVAAGLLTGCGPGTSTVTGTDSSDSTAAESSASDTGPGTDFPDPTTSGATETGATETGATDPSPTDATSQSTVTVTSGPDTDGGHTDETSDTVSMPDPGVPLGRFTCEGARWSFVEPTLSRPGHARIDSRGHMRVTSSGSVLDFDMDGNLVGQIDPPKPWGWGGIDAADNLYVSFRDEMAGRKRLRKFDVTGAMLWENDRGPLDSDFSGRVTVAPDGTTLVSDKFSDRLERYDASGAVIWDKVIADKPFREPSAMNSAGVAVALGHGADGAVLALAPDASVLWEHPFSSQPEALADIDESGHVVAVTRDWPARVIRLAPDGAQQWFLDLEAPELVDTYVGAIATNDAGQTALAFSGTLNGAAMAMAMRLTPNGDTEVRVCDSASEAQAIAIDEAGVIYLAGIVWAEDGEHLFATALD